MPIVRHWSDSVRGTDDRIVMHRPISRFYHLKVRSRLMMTEPWRGLTNWAWIGPFSMSVPGSFRTETELMQVVRQG